MSLNIKLHWNVVRDIRWKTNGGTLENKIPTKGTSSIHKRHVSVRYVTKLKMKSWQAAGTQPSQDTLSRSIWIHRSYSYPSTVTSMAQRLATSLFFWTLFKCRLTVMSLYVPFLYLSASSYRFYPQNNFNFFIFLLNIY